MALVAVSFFLRVEKKIRLRQFAVRPGWSRRRLFESYFDWIENVVPAMKALRTLVSRIEQIAQCRDGAVVKIRRAKPDSIQWR